MQVYFSITPFSGLGFPMKYVRYLGEAGVGDAPFCENSAQKYEINFIFVLYTLATLADISP